MRLVFGDSVSSKKMAASYNWPSVVMAIKVNKCNHLEAKNFMLSMRNSKMIEEIFNDCHVVDDHEAYEKFHTIKCECRTELHSNEKFEVEQFLTVTLFTNKNRQEPSRTDKSRQAPTRGIFMHFSIKILLIRPYLCVIYPN